MKNRFVALLTILSFGAAALPAQAQIADFINGFSTGLRMLSRTTAPLWQYPNGQYGYGSGNGNGNGNGQAGSMNSLNPGPYSRAENDNQRYRDQVMAIKLVNKGYKSMKHKNYQEAIQSYQEVLQMDPSMKGIHGSLGYAYHMIHDDAHALQELEIELQQDPRNSNLCYTAGLVALNLRNYEIANEMFGRYVQHKRSGKQAKYAREVTEILANNYFHPAEGDYFADATAEKLLRWKTGNKPLTLKVYIAENPNLRGYKVEYVPILQHSFIEWSRGCGGKIQFEFTNTASEAQISCVWTDQPLMLGSEEELGITQTTPDLDGYISSATITLSMLIDDSDCTAEQVLLTARNVDLHEIGHALGLDHSKKVYDIMHKGAFPHGLSFPLTARDINTLLAVYSQPDTTNLARTYSTSTEPTELLPVQSDARMTMQSVEDYPNSIRE